MRESTPITDSSSLDHDSACILPEALATLRLAFIDRMFSNLKLKKGPQKCSLQPIKIPVQNNQQVSAKSLMKKAIMIDPSPKLAVDPTTDFLMKGKMVSGQKKPIENQMASILESINERIKRELSRQLKILELPQLAQKQKDQKAAKKNSFDDTIFKNLKFLRSKRINEQGQQRKFIKLAYVQKRLTLPKYETVNNSNNKSQNYSKEQAKPIICITSTISRSLYPPLAKKKSQISFKKGYIAYDEQGKRFLDAYRSSMMKQYVKGIEKTRQITANAFLVLDCSILTPISGKNILESIQIASLSKIMTCYLCLLICKKFNVDIYTHKIRVSQKAAQTPGTTAELQSGDLLTVFELLMALMLPSGNDASVSIAQGMGKIIQRYKKKETKKNFYQIFVTHMNMLSKELQLNQSWGNSSGLSINPNFSTPEAMAILTSVALKDDTFKKIVSTKFYELDVTNQKYGLTRKITWKNTNKLLDSGWQGVKTGTTQNAGHCLMAKKANILICVFNCQTLSKRFTQCVYLYQRYINR